MRSPLAFVSATWLQHLSSPVEVESLIVGDNSWRKREGHCSSCNRMCWLHAQVRYLGLIERLKELMVDPVYDLNAAVYTELSDVEAEINGLITYDRQVMPKPYEGCWTWATGVFSVADLTQQMGRSLLTRALQQTILAYNSEGCLASCTAELYTAGSSKRSAQSGSPSLLDCRAWPHMSHGP